MRLNIFEGARRVALVAGALWTAGCIGYAAVSSSYAAMMFTVDGPGAMPVFEPKNECGTNDATKYKSAKTASGKDVSVTLCFVAHEASDGRILVPYTTKSDRIKLPDGTVIENVPADLSQAELLARLAKSGYDTTKIMKAVSPGEKGDGPWEQWRQDPEVPARLSYSMMNERYSSDVTAYTDRVGAAFTLPSEFGVRGDELLWKARLQTFKEAAIACVVGLAVGWLLVAIVGWVARGFLGIPRGADSRRMERPELA